MFKISWNESPSATIGAITITLANIIGNLAFWGFILWLVISWVNTVWFESNWAYNFFILLFK